MFHLNEAVAAWRSRLAVQPDLQQADLDELEDHLRESAGELQAAGLSDEEAFLLAARRLGDPDALAGEFAAADPNLRRRLRLRWIVVGALAMLVLRYASDIGAGFFVGGLGLVSVGPPLLGVAAGLMRIAVFVIGGVVIWRMLTDDRVAGRIRNLRFWSSGLVGAVVVALLLMAAAVLLRGGSVFLLSHGLAQPQFMQVAMVGQWFRLGLQLVLPVLLLVFLWALARPRRPAAS